MLIGILLSAITLAVLGLTYMMSKKPELDREQMSIFECGFNTVSTGKPPFSLRFYLLANLFLIFDVELIILFPFLTSLSSGPSISMSIFFCIFLLILSIGLFNEWNQKMLDWTK